MQLFHKTLSLMILLIGVFEPTLFGSTFQPSWAGKMITAEQELNKSYLTHTYRSPPPSNVEVLDKAQLVQLSIQYQDLTRNYDLCRSFGLIGMEREIQYFEQMSQFSKETAQRVKRHQVNRERKKWLVFLEQFKKNRLVKTIAKSIGFFGILAGVYFGKSFEFNLGKDFVFSGWTALSSKSGKVFLYSPWIESSLEVQGNIPSASSKLPVIAVDRLNRVDEYFKFVISHHLTYLELSSSVSYLGTSHSLVVSLIKKITPHLSFASDTYYPLRPEDSDLKALGETVRLSYAASF